MNIINHYYFFPFQPFQPWFFPTNRPFFSGTFAARAGARDPFGGYAVGNFEATGPTMVPVRHGDVIEVLETHHTGRTVEPPGETQNPWEKCGKNAGKYGWMFFLLDLNLGNGWRNGWVAGGCWGLLG